MMIENLPHSPLAPGVFQGTPKDPSLNSAGGPRLIRTMKSDMSDAIKNQNETLVSIALAEEKKQAVARAQASSPVTQEQKLAPAPKPRGRATVIIFIVMTLVILGLAYNFLLPKLPVFTLPKISLPSFQNFWATNTESASSTTPVRDLAPLDPSLIPAQFEKRFIINRESSDSSAPGKIKNLYFAEETKSSGGLLQTVGISANRLFIFAGISAPDTLTHSIESPFMAGLLSEGGASVPFLVLTVSSRDAGLAGMLEWERAIPRVLDTIFGTSFATDFSNKTKVRDVVILGRDTRVFDISPTTNIAYTFANPHTIILSGSLSALQTLLPLVK
jgi:hypothetical protein